MSLPVITVIAVFSGLAVLFAIQSIKVLRVLEVLCEVLVAVNHQHLKRGEWLWEVEKEQVRSSEKARKHSEALFNRVVAGSMGSCEHGVPSGLPCPECGTMGSQEDSGGA